MGIGDGYFFKLGYPTPLLGGGIYRVFFSATNQIGSNFQGHRMSLGDGSRSV